MAYSYQTLNQFLLSPFGKADRTVQSKYSQDYTQAKNGGKIRLSGYTKLDDSYLYHVLVRSESKSTSRNRYNYDVIIQFFPPNDLVKGQSTIENYNVKFFSNSPSFIYKYAALYKQNGFLIEALYDKLDKSHIDQMPDKTNASYEMSYDKSIYFACRFLQENRLRVLSKTTAKVLTKEYTPDEFFKSISDFATIKIDQMLISADIAISKDLKEISKDKKIEKLQRSTTEQSTKKKKKSKHIILKKVASKTTGGLRNIVNSVKPKSKKPRVHSTVKKK